MEGTVEERCGRYAHSFRFRKMRITNPDIAANNMCLPMQTQPLDLSRSLYDKPEHRQEGNTLPTVPEDQRTWGYLPTLKEVSDFLNVEDPEDTPNIAITKEILINILGIQDKHIPDSICCPLCKKFFKKQMKYRTNDEPGFFVHYRSCYADHLKNIKRFQCIACPYLSTTRENLRKHMMRCHNKTFDFKCQLCDFKTICRDYLRKHYKRSHTLSVLPIECHMCDYSTKTLSYMALHLKRHKVFRPYIRYLDNKEYYDGVQGDYIAS